MASSKLSGKLAVILHADVVGSTELVRRDEQTAHARIRETFQRLGDVVSRYRGQVRELRGDALLAEFERASDAVTASLAFQAQQAADNASLEDDIRPAVRVGIALGEVVVADDTITGAGVVLAQRLEQLAEPGGLCITPAVREALPQRLPFELDNLGEHELKGFDHAIGAFRVRLRDDATVPEPEPSDRRAGEPVHMRFALAAVLLLAFGVAAWAYIEWLPRDDRATPPAAQKQADKPSIAVLPFNNLSGDPDQDYFADGITEDLTTDLSRLSGLFVVARNSAFAYKGRSVDVRTVAEELGVRYVLEGSVRRAGEQIRINAQLVDGESGGHVWAERFDGRLADVFALQDDVNRKIVAALEVSLTAADEQRFDRVETTSPEAYDVLLRGVEKYNSFDRESVAEARDLFLRAAEIDPNYARAYANVALTHSAEVNFNWTENRAESIRLGLEYADRALALDDSIPQIYLTRSILYLSQRQHEAALEAAKRTIEVHPNYADGYATLGFIASYSGRYDEGLAAMEQAERINPQSTGLYSAISGRIMFLQQRYEEALSLLEHAIERNPAFDRTHLYLAATFTQLGRLDDAAWSVAEALAINPDISLSKERRESIYRRQSDLDHVIGALRKAGVPE